MKAKLMRHVRGYNLVEILVVLAIIGILILIALPNHTSTISKAKAVEAKTQLQHLHSLQKMFFYEKSKYSDDLKSIGFDHPLLVTEGGNANYMINITEVSSNHFKAEAVSIVDFDGDGQFNIWEIDQEKNLIEKVSD